MAAYLLRKQEATVTIFEASERVGGRIDSEVPIKNDAARFELGAMRVPPSERLFNYLWTEVFNLPRPAAFPDPGSVDTKLVFQNEVYDWPAQKDPPSIFKNVHTAWVNFAGSEEFTKIVKALGRRETFKDAQPLWQELVQRARGLGPERGYSSVSFFQGLVQAFVENYQKYKCEPWTARDFALFGALGIGSGGFGPLYQVNFAEIVRLVVNGLETSQQFYPAGLGSLTDRLANQVSSSILTRRRVVAVNHVGGLEHPVRVTAIDGSGQESRETFDAVVIATTTRSMQVDMDVTDPPPPNIPGAGRPIMPITGEQAAAVQQLHLMNSSKLFVLTDTKFWSAPGLPQNIQTDGLVRGLYCLDYPDSRFGVVLVSYTWGDDSTKYIAIKDPNERLDALLRTLAPYAKLKPFVAELQKHVLREHTRLVDWQDERQYYGAFKLNYPGQDLLNQDLYTQFLSSESGVYLAGDSVGWCGGWIEGALQTGMNAAAAIVQRFCGKEGLGPNSPMTQTAALYDYGV
jgi:tryptophan 2-monooxygenase